MDGILLFAAVMLVGLAVTVVVCLCCVTGIMLVRDVWEGYRELLARARRHPRFGIGALFSLLTIAATASALFRWSADDSPNLETWFLALVAVVFAIGIVCAVQFVAADFCDNWSRRRARGRHCDLMRQELASCRIDDAELPNPSRTP